MSIDIATLGIAIDSTDTTKATAELDKLTAAGNRTEGALTAVGEAGKKAAEGARAAADATGKATAATNRDTSSSKEWTAAQNARFAANKSTRAAQVELTAEQEKFITALQRQIETVGLSKAKLIEFRAAELGVSDQAKDMIGQLEAATEAIVKHGSGAHGAGNALEGFSLKSATAKRELMVITRELGRGDFNRAAGSFSLFAQASGLMAVAMTPVGIAIGAAAAAVGVLAYAFIEGAGEASAFKKAIIESGNVTGTTSDQLQDMAKHMGAIKGSQSEAAAGLAAFVAAGYEGSKNLELYAAAAMDFEKATGTAIAETVKHFNELAKGPLEATVALNEKYNYMTVAIYAQIKALEEQGKATEAATVAQKAFMDMMDSRSPAILENLGYIERGWNAVKGAVMGAVSAMAGVGRKETGAEKLADLKSQLEKAQSDQSRATGEGQRMFTGGGGLSPAAYERVTSELKKQIGVIESANALLGKQETLKADDLANAKTRAAFDKDSVQYSSKAEQSTAAVLAIQNKYKDILGKTYIDQKGITREVITQAEYNKLISDTKEKFVDKGKAKSTAVGDNDAIAAKVEAERGAYKLIEAMSKESAKVTAFNYKNGKITEEQAIQETADIELKAMADHRQSLEDEKTEISGKKNSLKAVAALTSQIALVEQAEGFRKLQMERDLITADEKKTKALEAQEKLITDQQRLNEVAALAYQNATLGDEASTSALRQEVSKLHLAFSELDAVELDGKALDALGNGQLALAQKLADSATHMREIAQIKFDTEGLKGATDTLKNLDAYLDPAKAKDFGTVLADSFGKAGTAIGKMAVAFENYSQNQEEFAKQKKALADDTQVDSVTRIKRESDLAQKSAQLQVSGYASMAGAAKGFFKEHSTGYRAMEAAEKTFRAVEMAMSMEAMLVKLFGIETVAVARTVATVSEVAGVVTTTTTVVTGEAVKQGAYGITALAAALAAPFPANVVAFAVVAAMLAAIGVAVSGGGGGSPQTSVREDRQKANGTGTVLGDGDAKSKSMENSLKFLADNAKIELKYQSGMLASLRNIEASMAGLAQIVIRTAGITSGNSMGIQTGTLAVNKGDALLGMLGFDDSALTKSLPLIGGFVAKIQALWGKTTQEITDSGLSVSGSVSALSAGNGFKQFADVKTTTSSWFGLSKSSSDSTQYADLESDAAAAFGRVFANLSTSLKSASGALGFDMEQVGATLAETIVSIPKLSLRGLKGADLKDAISAAISAASDTMTAAVIPGLQDFQKVGEGYFETIVRISTGVESAGYALEKFGITAEGFRSVVNKQGDVAAEIFRDSITKFETDTYGVASEVTRLTVKGGMFGLSATDIYVTTIEKAANGIAQVMQGVSGSVDDLAKTYASLVAARNSLKAVGANQDGIGFAMLRGAGGLENLQSGLDKYLSSFFTDTEKVAAQVASVAAQFKIIGVAVPDGVAGFRALVKGIDTSTDAGAALFGKLMTVAGSFSDMTTAVSDLAGTTNDAAKAAERLVAAEDKRQTLALALMRAQGNETGAVAVERAKELDALRLLGPGLADTQDQIYGLVDATKAAALATAAAKVVSDKAGTLNIALMRATGNETGAVAVERAKELAALRLLDPALADTQDQIYGLVDAAKAAAAAKAINDKTDTLNIALLRATGKESAAVAMERSKELAALRLLDPSLESLQQSLYDVSDATKAAADAQAALYAKGDAAVGALRTSIAAQKAVIQKAYDAQVAAAQANATTMAVATAAAAAAAKTAAQDRLTAIAGIFSALDGALKSAQIQSDALTAARRKAAQQVLTDAVAGARAGQSLTNFTGLQDALAEVAKPSESLFKTFEEYALDQAKTATDIVGLHTIAGAQQSVAQLTLDAITSGTDDAMAADKLANDRQAAAMKAQFDADNSALDQQQAYWDHQLNALKGIDDSVLSVADAIGNLVALQAKVLTVSGAAGGKATTAQIQDAWKTTGKSGADDASIKKFYDLAIATGTSSGRVDSALGFSPGTALKWAVDKGLPSFAIGTDRVPRDMLAMLHKDEIVVPAANAPAFRGMDRSGTDASLLLEFRAMRQEMAALRREQGVSMNAVATNTGNAATTLDNAARGRQPLITAASA